MRLVGIDPGLSGAVAIVELGLAYGAGMMGVAVHDLPVTARQTGKGLEVNARMLAALLHSLGPSHAVIERQGPMPKQGVTSVYSLGRTAGLIEGVLAMHGAAVDWVRPLEWKRAYGLTGKPKDASRSKALELFPGLAAQLTRKRDHGRAEALLIANWWRMTHKGEEEA